MKAFLSVIVMASVILLAGCGGPQIIDVKIGCQGGSSSSTECRGEVTFRWEFKSAGLSIADFDASLARVNLSQSNVTFLSSSGTMTLSIKNGASTVATTVVSWVRSGQYIYASNPQAVTNWVQANASAGDTVAYDIPNVDWDPQLGVNLFTAVFEYDYAPLDGDSSSLFMNEADLLGL